MVELNICSENQGGVVNSHQVQNMQVDPDLEDSEDEVAVNKLPDNAVSRRKLRMVIDLEDDDWCGIFFFFFWLNVEAWLRYMSIPL